MLIFLNLVLKDQIVISLGSNLGDRLNSIYKALALIESYPILIKSISKVYETPAWGFESDPFYNACIRLQTKLKPEALLEALLQIEIKMGRSRSSEKGYSSRIIDLDLLFYGDKKIFSSELKVPHPKLHKRNFVLTPLFEISPKFKHPILHQTIEQLLKKTSDKSKSIPLSFDLELPPIFKYFPFIAIEGNIGAGKTTLAKSISKHYNAELLSESFKKNPFLEDFYKDRKTNALVVENFFLEDRFLNDTNYWKKQHDIVVSDFSLYKCLVFASENLNPKECRIFKKKFDMEIKSKKTPNLLIFLKSSIPRLINNIKIRGREYEKDIDHDYLEGIEKGYKKLYKQNLPFPVLIIDVNEADFENDKNSFNSILRSIFRSAFL